MASSISALYARRCIEAVQESYYLSSGLSISLLLVLGVLYRRTSAPNSNGRFQDIYQAPFNMPLIGHIWGFLLDPDRLLRSNREKARNGIFTLNMFGTNTNIIHSPSLMKQFFSQPNSVIEHKTMGASISEKIFGLPGSSRALVVEHFDELMNTIVHNLMRGPGLERLWSRLSQETESRVPNLLSYAARPADQHPWERLANTTVGPTGVPEASLFPFIRNCVGHMSSRALMGTDLCDAHPDILEDIWHIDANIMGFIYGFPSWWPGIAPAYRARERVLRFMNGWHRAMEDEGVDSPRFEDVSDMMKARQRVYSARGFSIEARAAIDLSLVWALNANSNAIAYWMIFNINSTPSMLSRVRAEIAPHAHRANGKLSVDTTALMNKCPLFKSCYWESLRMDSGPWSFKHLQKDCVLQETADDARGPTGAERRKQGRPSDFSLRKGDVVLIPSDLHHTDPRYFPKPEQFIPERFMAVRDDDGAVVSEMGSIRPYGGGATICKGRVLAEREVLSFVAGILMCWDLEPVGGQGWKFEGRIKTSGVTGPRGDLRVRFLKRE